VGGDHSQVQRRRRAREALQASGEQAREGGREGRQSRQGVRARQHLSCIVALASGAACKGDAQPPPITTHAQPGVADASPDAASDAAGKPDARVAGGWREAYDLDGDGRNDRIVVDFTGGAHCCYRFGASLSSTGTTTQFPFEMDGGYVGALDLSQPDRFTVRTRPGSLPELVYEIAVYNGAQQPLDPLWTRTWGVRSHRVALCFAGGKPRAADDAVDLAPCR
jgi:hypothetical protein